MKPRLAFRAYVLRSGIVLSVCTASTLKAQQPAEHLYEIVFGTPITPSQEKFVHEGLRSQDPDPVVVVAHAEKKVWVGTSAILDQELFRDALAPGGLQITDFVLIHESGRSSGADASGTNEALPEYVSTGDVQRDNSIYDLKKRLWLSRRHMIHGAK